MPSAVSSSQNGSLPLYDVIIIGGSHAGLAAALTLYRALHRCLIIDSATPRNQSSDRTHLTPAWENKPAHELSRTARTELEKTGLVDFVSSTATSALKQDDGTFLVQDNDGNSWIGRKLLLAIGMNDVYPDIEGYAELYGHRIYYCMFCFGFEHRNAERAGLLATALLANPDNAITNAEDALKFVDSVTIYTNGSTDLAKAIRARQLSSITVDDRPITKLAASEKGEGINITFKDDTSESLAFLVHKPELVLDSKLPSELGLEMAPFFGIKVTPPFNQTNIEGVFAAGDCASPLRMIPNAITMGSFAGCGIARQLPRSKGRGNTDKDVGGKKMEENEGPNGLGQCSCIS